MDGERSSLQDFQRNTAFVVLVIVGGLAAFVYLTSTLVDVLVPLIWSAFFAVPLTGLIGLINSSVTKCGSWARWRRPGSEQSGIAFRATTGDNRIFLENGPAAKQLLEHLSHPFQHTICLFPSSRCCQSRIRITDVEVQGGASDAVELMKRPEVNRLVEKWHYYVREVPLENESDLCLELYLDQEELYPAVMSSGGDVGESLKGTIELDTKSILSWSFSVIVAIMILLVFIYVFALTIALGVEAFRANVKYYEQGLRELTEWIADHLDQNFPRDAVEGMKERVLQDIKGALPSAATEAALQLEATGFQIVLFLLYTLFWVFEPIPMNSNVAQVIKSYLLLKTMVCVLFAALISGLLYFLDCPLWHFFFIVAFMLNYIPELGFIITFCLMIPAICLDAHIPLEERERNTVIAIVVGLLIKVLTGNIIEVQMIVTKGGQYMRMHPVVLMATMFVCERLLGITGMFLAIPIIAAVKYFLLAADVPSVYLNPMLVMLEGDEVAPHKNFVDRKLADYGGTLDKDAV
jgi:predicted PurR-regulated permease PerM|mmetsp:Transcript_363/g.513  ORF Transcript_363/g.513 Transcript_363/m.513 type:complete len:521 (-) Transcript_363:46-1608(-)|eukprot:CAMPEP_0169075278 /NCGR_PEP_ID=MMETSP1015-20121227/7739_1 /TAXON_ID=342587 /ORGANISM="Karlodinium micrum, Strain CCMP2283" /LENGTH=520 /DNA_ID=CAMNT_0009134683 /DNA_START=39 /DNA_END=1601 /DNA_ORIENTATION=-